MPKNHSLLKAKNNRNDEFYTQYSDIEKELDHYKPFLTGKSIYLPCDSPYHSQFFRYFVRHFDELHLKSVTATCYDAHFGQLSLFEDYDDNQNVIEQEKRAYQAIIQEVRDKEAIDELVKLERNSLSLLAENGDFASSECIKLMKGADVVITNPPFSLFRKLLKLLKNLNKDFILLGSSQAIVYSEAFQWFQMNELHLGFTPFSSSLAFEVPEGNGYDKIEKGRFYKKVPIAWYTSFPTRAPVKRLSLTKVYSPCEYEKLETDASILNVDALSELPKNYYGKLAVPITFLAYWDRNEYQLLGKVDKAMVQGHEKFTRLLIQKNKK
ncbi:adenine-specific methyltransferase EcoRI family protein [Lactococcus lactis]